MNQPNLLCLTLTVPALHTLYTTLREQAYPDTPYPPYSRRTLNHIRLLIEGYLVEDVEGLVDVEALFEAIDTHDDVTLDAVEQLTGAIQQALDGVGEHTLLALIPIDHKGTLMAVMTYHPMPDGDTPF